MRGASCCGPPLHYLPHLTCTVHLNSPVASFSTPGVCSILSCQRNPIVSVLPAVSMIRCLLLLPPSAALPPHCLPAPHTHMSYVCSVLQGGYCPASPVSWRSPACCVGLSRAWGSLSIYLFGAHFFLLSGWAPCVWCVPFRAMDSS